MIAPSRSESPMTKATVGAIDRMTQNDSDQSLLTGFNIAAPESKVLVLPIWEHEKGGFELSIFFTSVVMHCIYNVEEPCSKVSNISLICSMFLACCCHLGPMWHLCTCTFQRNWQTGETNLPINCWNSLKKVYYTGIKELMISSQPQDHTSVGLVDFVTRPLVVTQWINLDLDENYKQNKLLFLKLLLFGL